MQLRQLRELLVEQRLLGMSTQPETQPVFRLCVSITRGELLCKTGYQRALRAFVQLFARLFDPMLHCLETALREPKVELHREQLLMVDPTLVVGPVRLFVRPEGPRRIETRGHFCEAAAIPINPKQALVNRDERPKSHAPLVQGQRLVAISLLQPTPAQACKQQCVVAVLLMVPFQSGDGGVQMAERRVDRGEIYAGV